MIINERICLIIDNCLLIARHARSFTFIGGSVNGANIKIGETCMHELKEELGIEIQKTPSLISYYATKNKLQLLFYLNITKNDLTFTRASHVWEISGFTLIPTTNIDRHDVTTLAEWLIKNIKTTNPCSSYISLRSSTVTALETLPKKYEKNTNNIFVDDDSKTYYIKLVPYPKLSSNEKGLLKYVNLQINGKDDELYVFNNDVLCNLQYVPYRKYMFLQIATNSITQIGNVSYSIDATYDSVENEEDIKKNMKEDTHIPENVVKTIKSLVFSVKQKLSEIGLNNIINTSFYYLDKDAYCCQGDQEVMFDDVDDFDYIKPILKLAKYYEGSTPNYYETVLEKFKDVKLNAPLYIYDFDYEMDEMLLQYVKCINNLSVMITWAVSNITDIYKSPMYAKLVENGTIHAIKEIVVTQKQLQGIIYQVYYDKSVFKQFEVIKSKSERCGYAGQNRLFIIFYKANDVKSITGTDAPFKSQLRKLLKENSGNKEDLKENLYLHISDNHTEAVELSQLFCNKNSMRLLQYQRLDRLLKNDFYKSLIFFMTFKSWLYSAIKPVDQIRFMLFSSIILWILGLRGANDLDLLAHYLPDGGHTQTPDFYDKINIYLENDKTKFPFIVDNVTMRTRGKWQITGEVSYLEQWMNHDWPALVGAKSMDQFILDPKFHFYFFGLKIVMWTADIERRKERARSASYADLIAMKRFIFNGVEIPKIPQKYWKNHVEYEYTPQEINKMLKTTIFYLRSRYNINMDFNEIKRILVQ